MGETKLLLACRAQVEKDNTPERRSQFAFLLSGRPAVRSLYHLLETSPLFLRAAACLAYALSVSAFLGSRRSGGKLAITLHKNEEKCVGLLWPEIASRGFDWMKLRKSPASILYSWLFFLLAFAQSPASGAALFRLAYRLTRRYPFFVALRGAETALRYAFFQNLIRRKGARAFLISTDGNPHGRALMAAAAVSGVPLIFASHGAIAQHPAPIECALALLYGKRSQQVLLRPGSSGKVLLYGFRDVCREQRPLSIPRKIVICLGQSVGFEALATLIARLGANFPGCRLVVRPHPHNLAVPGDLQEKGLGAGLSSAGLETDLQDCELVVAPNSTVHLECLLRGIPTIYLPELDAVPQRPLPFLAGGLAFRWENWCSADLSVSALNLHYQRPETREEVGAYMNIAYGHDEFMTRFRRELAKMLPEEQG